MFEDVSIGDLAAAALGTGSDAVTRGLAQKDVKEAYKALKKHADIMARDEVASLELLPHSVARRGVVGHILDGNSEEYDKELHVLVKSLIGSLKMEGSAGGVDLNYLLLLETHFDKKKVAAQAPAAAVRRAFMKAKKVKASKLCPTPEAGQNSVSHNL